MNSFAISNGLKSRATVTWWSSHMLYWSLWLFIIFVSVWDSFLTFVFRSDMKTSELNPIGRWLINLNGGDVVLLLVAKLAGTIVVTSLLAVFYERDPRKAFAITTPISCFQMWLLLFLTFG